MYLTKPQFNALVSIVRNYDASKPNKVGSIPLAEQEYLTNVGYCFVNGENILPTVNGWKKIITNKEVPVEITQLSPVQNKEKTADYPKSGITMEFVNEDTFKTMIDSLIADFVNNQPAEITFSNFKKYMNHKVVHYMKGWNIDDFRKANRFIYDNIVEVLNESNAKTLHLLLDLFYLLRVENDLYEIYEE